MPVLKEITFTDEQVFELVKQLDFKKKMTLIKEIAGEEEYRENFYAFAENLTQKHNIPQMTEEQLDAFLHD